MRSGALNRWRKSAGSFCARLRFSRVLRNYTLVVLGLNTALRISDLLNLRWRSVYDFKKNCFRDHLLIWEHKTGKRNYIAINQNAKNALYLYFMEKNPDPEEYVFSKRTNPYKPLSRSQAYRIIKEDASHTTSEEAISCHSLRKTFGSEYSGIFWVCAPLLRRLFV